MTAAEPIIFDIPATELEDIDEFAFAVLGMDREAVMEDFDDVYENTRAKSFDALTCKGMFATRRIERIGDDAVQLEGGTTLQSPLLARMLGLADEVACYAVTVHGFDVLAKDPANEMFDSMFYNAWGIGFSMSCHRWIKQRIADQAGAAGCFMGRSWTPGEDELEFSLQPSLFEVIDPSLIGIALTETGLMSPLLSVSGLVGISGDPGIESVGTDLPSCH